MGKYFLILLSIFFLNSCQTSNESGNQSSITEDFKQDSDEFHEEEIQTEDKESIVIDKTGHLTYSIGDKGPAGGIIFYDDTVGFDFDGNLIIDYNEKDLLDGINDRTISGDRYLESAPSEWNGGKDPTAYWGLLGIDSILPNLKKETASDLSESIGKGELNTAVLIKELLISSEMNRAAQLCNDYSGGNQSDWFLPSLGELQMLYRNLNEEVLDLGGILYWSSTERDQNHAWFVNFGNGCSYENYLKSDDFRYIRPIRAF